MGKRTCNQQQKVEDEKLSIEQFLPYGCHHPSSLYTRTTADTDNKSASFFFSSQLPGGKVLGANNEKDQIKESIMPKATIAVDMKLLKLVQPPSEAAFFYNLKLLF